MIIDCPSIKDAITDLYETARIRPTSAGKISIVPLNLLIGAFGIECVELPNLSAKAAIEFLSKYDPTIESDRDTDQTPLAGYLYITTNYGCVFVNQSDRVTRRRFSAAHELGHYLLHFRPIIDAFKFKGELISPLHHADEKVADDDPENEMIKEKTKGKRIFTDFHGYEEFLPSLDQMEDEADAFASELLMPADVLCARATSYNLLDDLLARQLASEFFVSRSAIERKLRELSLIKI